MPNEVDLMGNIEENEVREKIKINQEKFVTTVKPTTVRPNQGTTADFTGKLLADQDDLITEIESKFQLHETTTIRPRTSTSTTISPTRQHPGHTFIDRRVKKSFEFPMQHRASDVMAMPHIDFANTKFQQDADPPAASHPEFSTTKFYNSKELYNEMLLHNKRKLMKAAAKAEGSSPIKSAEDTTRVTTNLNVTPEGQTFNPTTSTASGTTSSATTPITTTTTVTESATTTTTTTSTTTTGSSTTTNGKYQKQLKRAKLLLKALTPPPKSSDKTTAAGESPSSTSTSTTTTATLLASARTRTRTRTHPPSYPPANPTKAASKPIARPRILSRLQEKINSLECEIPPVPQDSHLWRGNETHELLLPIVTTEHCRPDEHCIPNVLTWRGEAEIQSGDILIVEINDAMLNPSHEPNNTSSAVHATQVYQVTRSGHEHCDVTEGVLLDITPLVVDGRKLVTLYDKDLT
ncbi:hypothetical protein M5D96_003711 [Drosophila gunungcola]|uniref:Uncharacterized protein n=2 Tax=Drosophila gunungcola TaxID=103775 RepID=A0A9P9YTC6_9MUSC|nr:hypothetical protein M5D96_003711 [Drosophila gunungcola]